MAPISLKDPNIQRLTEEFVKVLTGFKKSSRNFTVSVQFALSNFRYHQFLDVNSLKVERSIDGVCQKLRVHSQAEKAEILRNLCNRFLDLPLSSSTQEKKTDAHYSLLLLLLTLSSSPTSVDYVPLTQEEAPEEEWFDWKSYLLDGEEEEILGIPADHYQAWSDEEDDELEATSDSGISVFEGHPTLRHPDGQLQEVREYGGRDQQESSQTASSPSKVEKSWISDNIVDQYWQEPLRINQLDMLQSRNCSVADAWESYQQQCNPFYHNSCNKTLTETQIVRETLWMLTGAQNTFVYRNMHHGILAVRENIQVLHLTPECLNILLSVFVVAGQRSHSLQKFVSSALNPHGESTQTLQAFATALSSYFKEYKALLSSIEKDIIKQEVSVSLSLLKDKLKTTLDEINTLFSVYQAIFLEAGELNTAQKTCRLLTTLYKTIVQADDLGNAGKWKVNLLLKIFLQSLEPCLSFIDYWVTSGLVCDPHSEFFIERKEDISVDSSSFWSEGVILRSNDQLKNPVVPSFLQEFVNQIFRAGKSVELTQGLGKMGEYHSSRTQGSLYQQFLDGILTELPSYRSPEDSGPGGDTNQGNLLNTIADSNQVLSVISDAGDNVLKLSFMDSSSLNQSTFSIKSSVAGKLEKICSGVVGLLKPVKILLHECLTPLIEERCSQGSISVVRLLKTEFCLLDHLAAMRNFFLLEAGDAMHQFYVEIFNKARRLDPWQDISFLNSLMQEALQPRFPQVVDRLVVSLSATSSNGRKQLGQSLQGLGLTYKAPWPVNIVIDGSCQKLYNLVFLFLLKLKQAKWSLDELRFSDLQGDRRLPQEKDDVSDEDEAETKPDTDDSRKPDQDLLHKMFVFRFKLMQFINSIHNHFMTRILHSTGLEFQQALNQAHNLDDLIKAHSTYIQKVYDRCLLSQKVGYLREVILKVLNLVLLFQSYWDNGIQHISEKKFNKIDDEFTKCNTFLVSCLGNIVKRGVFPHLDSLAFALSSSLIFTSNS
ncbi:unnamed protein product [Porites evermanni]|uniref:Gamma-tubulin complex component n=1 Tax=Porites evermanni TaxID=104178 RepID=A0ABN8LXE8_9CNID|nr:unnamed protein product [Porites evermanni]